MDNDDENIFEDEFFDEGDDFGDVFDDDDDDDFGDTPRPVPHPDDRLWRHPSELAAFGAPSATSPAIPSPTIRSSESLLRTVSWRRARPLVATAATVAVIALGISQLNNGNTTVADQAGAFPNTITMDSSLSGIQLNASRADTGDISGPGAGGGQWQSQLHAEIAPMAPTIVALSSAGVTKQRGLVLDREGHVITIATGLDDADTIRVIDEFGSEHSATVVGADAISNLAVLATDPPIDNTTMRLVTTAPRIGDPVFVTGDDHDETVVARVNATRQRFESSATASFFDATHVAIPAPMTLPGTPALNDTGSVIGIVAEPVFVDPGSRSQIVAMIPARTISAVSDEIIATGHAIWPWIGVELEVMDDPNTGAIGPNNAVMVATVQLGSPAEKAGVHIGDRITHVDGQAATSPEMIGRTVQAAAVGDRVALRVDRGGTPVELTATLTGRTDATVEVAPIPTPG